MKKITIFDSTLRDGAQAEGISFSVEDKIKIVKTLDELGISYIEAGNPGSNPKDLEFFEKVKELELKNSKLTAFGATRRAGIGVDTDNNILSLLKADTEAISVFGKSWDFHVTDIIKTTLDENLKMIFDTINFFKRLNKDVTFDAEHFFDGYKANKEYAIKSLDEAFKAGADCLCLCDTNGGTFPDEIYSIVKEIVSVYGDRVGIHCHNDCGMAVANSIMAVNAGANHVQGTFLGYGERCGNANLSTIIANLQIKQNMYCILPEKVSNISESARVVAEISNVVLSDKEPYVGRSAFSHKGGMHIDGVAKNTKSFEHISPELVGNERKFLTSEVAGRVAVLNRIQKFDNSLKKDSEETKTIIAKIKDMEHNGYQFEGADATVDLIILKVLGRYKPFFELRHYKTIGESPYTSQKSASALINVSVDGCSEVTEAEGDGPIHALDKALRKALHVFYPELDKVHLIDYKVRVMDGCFATASQVRVLIESSDGKDNWCTVGVSNDIIEASWIALVDSIEYKLIKDLEWTI